MNKVIFSLISLIICATFSFSASAQTAKQKCQSNKNKEVGRYFECIYKAQFLKKISSRQNANKRCSAEFTKEWKKINSLASKANAVCFDAPLESEDYDSFIRNRTNAIAALLGNSSKSRVQAQLDCRRKKSIEVGNYSACRLAAEAAFARKPDLSQYNSSITRCEKKFSRVWKKIISDTKRRNAKCLDHSLPIEDYKSLIDAYSLKVASVLAGNAELEPVALVVTGSPLKLVVGGAAQSLSITNSSEKATLSDIKSNFAGTALEGKVTESSNNCANLAPNATCTLSFSPGNVALASTDFPIQGSGSLSVLASIIIETAAVLTPTPTLSPAPTSAPSSTPTATPTATPTITATPTVTSTATVTPTPTSTSTPVPATLNVTGSPLQLTVNGSTGVLTITNTSISTTALNISSDFTGTALDGNVTETGNTCASVAPGASCTLTFTPGSTIVAATSFSIQGTNTVAASASIEIISGTTLTVVSANSGSASGGTGVTLTGTGLTGATSVTFGGVSATSVNVVNSTTVTAVSPAHAVGVVDVVIDTPAGGATLLNGFTYLTTAVGQASGGGTIACLNGGSNDLIASTSDNSSLIGWSASGTAIGAGAQSTSDGATNTSSTVVGLGSNGGTPYAAGLCSDYEIDSQGNTPCQAGNTCYSDWFLPSGNNSSTSGQLNCLYTNRISIGGFASAIYWSSTESSISPTLNSWAHNFSIGSESVQSKFNNYRVRCVRAFTP